MIQAAVLAGGLGTRMRPFTETVPKPMLAVLGRPFLEHQLDLLIASGIGRVLILAAYLGTAIEQHFGDEYRGARILYSHEPEPLGTGGALQHAAAKLEEEFLLINGDTLLAIDYARLAVEFRARQTTAMVAAFRNTHGAVASNLAVDADGFVTYYRKDVPAGEFVDAGVIALRRAVLDLIPQNGPCSLERQIFPKLIASRQLAAWPTDTPFFDMGTPDGLQALEKHLASG